MKSLMSLDPSLARFVVEYTKDFNRLRAARSSGIHPGQLDEIMDRPVILEAIAEAVNERNRITQLDAEWVMTELADNHIIAKQMGNLSVSNKALELIGKLSKVDAFAAQKIDVSVSDEMVDMLRRGRERAAAKVIDVKPVEIPYASPVKASDTPSFL